MLSIKSSACRALRRNFHQPLVRWLSVSPARARNDPNVDSQKLKGGQRYEVSREKRAEHADLRRGHHSKRQQAPLRPRNGRSRGNDTPHNDFRSIEYDEHRDNPRFEASKGKPRYEESQSSRCDPVSDRALRGDPRRDSGRRVSPPRPGGSRVSQGPRGTSSAPKKAHGIALMPRLSPEEEDKINTPQKLYEANLMCFMPPKRAYEPQNQLRGTRNNFPALSASAVKAEIHGIPETSSSSSPSDGGTISVSPVRGSAYAQSTGFFRSPKATFLYSAYRFKQHPLNTTTPELCIVGASNCGKSTFVNALTGASAELAKVSHKAGKTVAMNAYGVGGLSGIPHRAVMSPAAAGEEGTRYGMVLVDTPGYGYASRKEWGREVVEYLSKRTMLRGVVLLLSAEKRVSGQDETVMRMLAEAGRPAMVVFTKMDKALRSKARQEGGVAERLREVERCFARTGWDGWVPRIHLTAAKMDRAKDWKTDATYSAAGMAGVRMEILEMVGLRQFVAPQGDVSLAVEGSGKEEGRKTVEKEAAKDEEELQVEEEKRQEPGKAMESDPTAWDGEIVSYDELQKKFGDWSS